MRQRLVTGLLAAALVLAGAGACAGEDCDAEDRRERDRDCGYVDKTRKSPSLTKSPSRAPISDGGVTSGKTTPIKTPGRVPVTRR